MWRASFSERHNTAEKKSISNVVDYFPCVGKKKKITRRQSLRWSKGTWCGNGRKRRKGVMEKQHRKRRKKGDGESKGRMAMEGPGKGRNRGGVAWAWENRQWARAAISGQYSVSRLLAVQGAWHHAHLGARRGGRYDADLWLHPRTAPRAGVFTQHICRAAVGPHFPPSLHRLCFPALSPASYFLFLSLLLKSPLFWLLYQGGFSPEDDSSALTRRVGPRRPWGNNLEMPLPVVGKKHPRLCVLNGFGILEVPAMPHREVSYLSA